MKKNFKSFIIIWAAGLVLFNLCAFLIPTETRFTPNFWSGYGFITVAFVLQLGIAYFAFKEVNKEKLFLSIPTITVSFITLVCTAIAGAVAMAVEGVPEWVGSVVGFACVGFGVASTLLSKTAGDLVSKKEEKIKVQTFFIKSLTVDADTLVAQAQMPEIKAQVTKVYEAIRYSDPMSNDALAGTEAQITLKFNELQNAVTSNDATAVQTISNELLVLIKDRNSKCKLLK
jgi:hypothetical protein